MHFSMRQNVSFQARFLIAERPSVDYRWLLVLEIGDWCGRPNLARVPGWHPLRHQSTNQLYQEMW